MRPCLYILCILDPRRLLARVCLVREEVQNVAREASYSSGRPGAGFQPTAAQAARLRGACPAWPSPSCRRAPRS